MSGYTFLKLQTLSYFIFLYTCEYLIFLNKILVLREMCNPQMLKV